MDGIKVLILNGSPKGMTSVTMQYTRYLEKRFPRNEYGYINAAQACAKYERNVSAFNEVIERVREADLILWAFPLYFLLVCSQYKRFIELIFEREGSSAFTGKYSAAISTSIHFFDNTAMNYIRAVAEDLGMKFTGEITAKMDDLRDGDFRRSFDQLFVEWENSAGNGLPCSKAYSPVEDQRFKYSRPESLTVPAAAYNPARPCRVCIVGDLEAEDSGIRNMAAAAADAFTEAGSVPEIIDLRALRFGPCTGCLKCGFDNVCTYEGRDEFITIHREHILRADIIVFAGEMHDRYLSSIWQRYLERTFNRTHQLTLQGKQTAFLISGPLSRNHIAREILQAYVEVNRGTPAGFVTDESGDCEQITAEITALAGRMLNRVRHEVRMPQSFLGLGGTKIFRDEIYSHLRFVFQADHKAYRKQRLYDFPHKRIGLRIMTSAAMLLTKLPSLRRIIRRQLKSGMINPFKKVLEGVRPAD